MGRVNTTTLPKRTSSKNCRGLKITWTSWRRMESSWRWGSAPVKKVREAPEMNKHFKMAGVEKSRHINPGLTVRVCFRRRRWLPHGRAHGWVVQLDQKQAGGHASGVWTGLHVRTRTHTYTHTHTEKRGAPLLSDYGNRLTARRLTVWIPSVLPPPCHSGTDWNKAAYLPPSSADRSVEQEAAQHSLPLLSKLKKKKLQ